MSDELVEHTQTESLFDGPPPPTRRASRGYLAEISGDYAGLAFWALAPVDRLLAAKHHADPARSEFVWLVDDHRLRWALVDVETHSLLALDPKPRDMAVRHALAYREPPPPPLAPPEPSAPTPEGAPS